MLKKRLVLAPGFQNLLLGGRTLARSEIRSSTSYPTEGQTSQNYVIVDTIDKRDSKLSLPCVAV